MAERILSDADYRRLYEFRGRLRRFLQWSEGLVREAGITPAQYLLLLAVRAEADPAGPAIGGIAEFLGLRHHTVVELVDRAAGIGLIRRRADDTDRRVVRLELTPAGRKRVERLASLHVNELSRLELAGDALRAPEDG